MPSKTSYFNPTLFRKNLTRFWPLWGGASLLGALVPLTMLMGFLQSGYLDGHNFQPLEMTRSYYYVLAYAVPILSLLYASLCTLAVWHYLYNARSVSLYHALPITRKGLFLTNFLSGLAMMLIPYAVTGVLSVLVSLVIGAFEPVGLVVTVLGVLGLCFFYASTATLVAFITGNPFAFAAFYYIFHFLAAGIEWLVSALMTEFYFGVNVAFEGVALFLSPTLYLVENVQVSGSYAQTVTPDGWIDENVLESVTLQNGWLIAVYALAGAVLLGGAWLLYCRRRSESAGDVVAVGWMKPIFRYGVSICAAASGGMLLYALLWEGFQTRTTASAVPMAVCMALAGILGYYAASMLLAKSFKVFRGSGKGILAVAAASAALCAVIALDPAGVETWVPRAEDLESVSFYVNSGVSNASLTSPADIQKLLDVQSAILAEKDSLNLRNSSADGYTYLRITFRHPDGSRTWRDYSIHYSQEDLARPGAVRALADLVTDPAVQESNIFGYLTKEGDEIRLTGGYVSGLYDGESKTAISLDLTLEQAQVLEEAIRRDIQAGHFGKTAFMMDYTAQESAIYYTDIQLHYNITRSYTSGPQTYSNSAYLSFSVYCTETIRALEEIGVVGEGRSLLTSAEYDQRIRYGDMDKGFYEDSVYYPDGHPFDMPAASTVYLG